MGVRCRLSSPPPRTCNYRSIKRNLGLSRLLIATVIDHGSTIQPPKRQATYVKECQNDRRTVYTACVHTVPFPSTTNHLVVYCVFFATTVSRLSMNHPLYLCFSSHPLLAARCDLESAAGAAAQKRKKVDERHKEEEGGRDGFWFLCAQARHRRMLVLLPLRATPAVPSSHALRGGFARACVQRWADQKYALLCCYGGTRSAAGRGRRTTTTRTRNSGAPRPGRRELKERQAELEGWPFPAGGGCRPGQSHPPAAATEGGRRKRRRR